MRHPLLAWIDDHHPRAAETLRAPATEDAIAAARLPEPFAALYRAHDGQDEADMATVVFDEGMYWLPLDDGARQREMFITVLEGVRREFPEQEPFGPDWLPFAGDLLGNVFVVDVAKDEVFYFDHAEGRADGEAPSSEAFLAGYLAQLESGERVIDPKLGPIDPSLPSRPPPPPGAPEPPRAAAWLTIGLAALAVIALALYFALTR